MDSAGSLKWKIKITIDSPRNKKSKKIKHMEIKLIEHSNIL